MRMMVLMEVEDFENPVDHYYCYYWDAPAAVETADGVVGAVVGDCDDNHVGVVVVAVLSTEYCVPDDDDGGVAADRRQGRRVPPLSLLAHLRDDSFSLGRCRQLC